MIIMTAKIGGHLQDNLIDGTLCYFLLLLVKVGNGNLNFLFGTRATTSNGPRGHFKEN